MHEERFFTNAKTLAVLGENGGNKQTDAQAQESNSVECEMILKTCHDRARNKQKQLWSTEKYAIPLKEGQKSARQVSAESFDTSIRQEGYQGIH